MGIREHSESGLVTGVLCLHHENTEMLFVVENSIFTRYKNYPYVLGKVLHDNREYISV
jgi:hypothetical protein